MSAPQVFVLARQGELSAKQTEGAAQASANMRAHPSVACCARATSPSRGRTWSCA